MPYLLRPPRRALLALALALLVPAAGCGSDAATAPNPAATLRLLPAGTVHMTVGDTLRLLAEVQNLSPPQVEFASSTPAVATVSGTGLVTALTPGTAGIVATATAQPSLRDAVVIAVSPRDSAGAAAPRVSIVALQGPGGAALSLDAVRDTASVVLLVEPGGAARLEVLLDSLLACSATVAGGGGSRTLVCPVDTGRFDPATGTATFRNGRVALAARLLGTDGRVLASAGGIELTLANRPRVIARASGQREATDSAGRTWLGGDLRLSAVPVTFAPEQRVGRASFEVRVPGRTPLARVDEEAPFEVVVPLSPALVDLTTDSLRVAVTTATVAGQEGPSTVLSGLRYDSRPPPAGTLAAIEWAGEGTPFAPLYAPPATADAGVGGGGVTFFAGAADLAPEAVLSRGTVVARGGDLPEAAAGTYQLVARVCDALENCVLVPGAWRFGVDRVPPGVSTISLPDRAVNPTQELVLSITDDRSGPRLRGLLAETRVLRVGPAAPECGPVLLGVDLPGRTVNGACVPDTVLPVLRVPTAPAGYYAYTLTPLDRAGNAGAVVRRTFLVDTEAPGIASFALPGRLSVGQQTRFEAAVSDNLDLVEGSIRLVYAAAAGADALALPFAGSLTFGAAFDDTLTTQAPLVATMPFVQSLSLPGSVAGSRITVEADSVRVRAVDAAGNATSAARSIPPESVDGKTSGDPFTAILSSSLTLSSAVLCTGGCIATDVVTGTASARFSGVVGMRTPFDRVYLFRQAAGGRVTLLGSTGSASISDTGSQTTYLYTLPLVAQPGVTGRQTIFLVGVRGGGGFKTEGVTLDYFAR